MMLPCHFLSILSYRVGDMMGEEKMPRIGRLLAGGEDVEHSVLDVRREMKAFIRAGFVLTAS